MPESEIQARLSPRYWVLFVLAAVYLVNLVDRSIVYILQEQIKAEFGLSDRQIGLIGGTAFGLCYAVMGIPIARLAERRNRRTIIACAAILWSALTAACGFTQNFAQLLLARAGVAVGEAGGTPPSHSIISDYFPREQRATALAIYSLAVPLGLLAGATAGGALAHSVGWRWTFAILGLPGLLAAAAMLTIREPPRGHADGAVVREDAEPLGAVLRRAWRTPAYLHVLAGSTVVAFSAYGVTSFTAAFFIRRFALDLGTVGMVFGLIFGVAAGVGMLLGGYGADRLARRDRRYYALFPALCLALAGPLFMLGFAQSSWMPAAALLLAPGMFAQMHIGATFGIAQNSFPPRMRTTAIALMFLVQSVFGMALGPLAVGALSDLIAGARYAGDYAACSAPCHASAACHAASVAGLQQALVVISAGFLWAAGHYVLAARHMSDGEDK